MKKNIFLLFILLLVFMHIKESDASVNDYTTFARINVSDGKMLRDFKNDEINNGLERVKNRKFMGWRIHYFNKNIPCDFIAKTIYSNYNTGTTPVEYNVDITAENVVKTSISATGSIGSTIKGGMKEFSGSLSNELKINGSYEETSLVKQKETLKIQIDPNTMCVIYIMGRGFLTNGVAKFYNWWIGSYEGGFEYFTITDSYVRIEKVAL